MNKKVLISAVAGVVVAAAMIVIVFLVVNGLREKPQTATTVTEEEETSYYREETEIPTTTTRETQGRDYYECKPVFENELTAQIKSHGGADFYAVHYFIQQILGDSDAAKYTVDVYQALDMALPGILGYRSILGGNIPIEIPNFRSVRARIQYYHQWRTKGK